MPPKKLSALIKKMVRLVTSVDDVEKMILFGSYAKGNPTLDSDLDMAIILSRFSFNAFEEKLENKVRISTAIRPIKDVVEVDLKLYARDEWETATKTQNWFSREILKTGVTVYAK